MSELGPISQAMMDYIQTQPDYIEVFRMIYAVSRRTGASQKNTWYFRRLMALTLEGRIEAKLTREGDKVNVRFRRLQEA